MIRLCRPWPQAPVSDRGFIQRSPLTGPALSGGASQGLGARI